MPDKHTRLSESILGLSALVVEVLGKKKMDIDSIWEKCSAKMKTKSFPYSHSFESLILAIDFLYIAGSVRLDPDGKLELCV